MPGLSPSLTHAKGASPSPDNFVCANSDYRSAVDARPLVDINRKALEIRERAVFKRACMRGPQHHARRALRKERLPPSRRAQAPAITGPQTRKAIIRQRRREVVSAGFREFQKFRSHDRADCMTALVLVTGVTAAIPENSGHWIERANLQRLTEDVQRRLPPTTAPRTLFQKHRITHIVYTLT